MAVPTNVEQVEALILQGRILQEDELSQLSEEWAVEGSGKADNVAGFLNWLTERNAISRFHADAVQAGIGGPYTIGPYRVFERMFAGRLGSVFRAEHEDLKQSVSLKIFPAIDEEDHPEWATRLSRETRISVQANHPSVVRTFQVGRVGETAFLALDPLEGETLSERLNREGTLSVKDTLPVIFQAAQGLKYLHSLEILHRDLEPSNLWITKENQCKLMEFSGARDALEAALTEDMEEVTYWLNRDIQGDLDYLSAEQVAYEDWATVQTDIYSLGCIFYRCVTGQVVYPEANPIRKVAQHAMAQPPSAREANSDVPADVSQVIETMLAKQFGEPYADVNQLLSALEGLMGNVEHLEMVAQEINPEFLSWAAENQTLTNTASAHSPLADPEFHSFMQDLESRDPDRETSE